MIQNRNSVLAKAAYALQSTHRWAVTGTPIQNKLTDLQSLLGFLRFHPFASYRTFDTEIVKPWKRSDPDCIPKLKMLVNCTVLCRDKATINLPPRSDEIYYLDLSHEEGKVYNAAKTRTTELLNSVIAEQHTQKGAYLNALQWLNDLRLICNHGVQHKARTRNNHNEIIGEGSIAWNRNIAQDAFVTMIAAGSAVCAGCSNNLVESLTEDDVLEEPEGLQPLLSECLFLLCGSCRMRSVEDPSFLSRCDHSPRCPSVEVGLSNFSTGLREQEESSEQMEISETPTKVKALLEGLQKYKNGEKRHVKSYCLKCLYTIVADRLF